MAEDLRRLRLTHLCAYTTKVGFHRPEASRARPLPREVERRDPSEATTTWWRKDRELNKVFLDYNQNSRDHTIASAYSVRGVSRATVSTPVTWAEVQTVVPEDCTISTVPRRLAELGDIHSGIDEAIFPLDELLEWADRDERGGEQFPPG